MALGKLQSSPRVHSTLHIKLLIGSAIKQTPSFEVAPGAPRTLESRAGERRALRLYITTLVESIPPQQPEPLLAKASQVWVTELLTGELRLPTHTEVTQHPIHSSHAPLSPRISFPSSVPIITSAQHCPTAPSSLPSMA